jgi:hypothetical protein
MERPLAQITVIIGPIGSGKTTLIKNEIQSKHCLYNCFDETVFKQYNGIVVWEDIDTLDKRKRDFVSSFLRNPNKNPDTISIISLVEDNSNFNYKFVGGNIIRISSVSNDNLSVNKYIQEYISYCKHKDISEAMKIVSYLETIGYDPLDCISEIYTGMPEEIVGDCYYDLVCGSSIPFLRIYAMTFILCLLENTL